ncbi:MAG: hypothetical protein RLZZ524_658 [Pseudomonadota bacterium]|jgi:hypothetical protein
MSIDRVKVKRDGPRGWHWIAAAHYDPKRHELVADEPVAQGHDAQPATAPKRRGRPPKNLTP